jgi:DNA-binding CsgD family transcriptional regulator
VQHLTVLGLTMALVAGLVGVTLSVRLAQSFPSRFLRTLLYSLLLFNLLIVFGIALRYLELHVLGGLSSRWRLAVALMVLNLMAMLKICFVYNFLEMNTLVVGHTLTDQLKRLYLTVGTGLLGLVIAASVVSPFLSDPGAAFTAHTVLEYLILSIIYAAIFQQFVRSFELPYKGARAASRSFFAIHFTAFSAIVISLVLSATNDAKSIAMYLLFNSLMMFVYNSLLVFWAYRYAPILEPVVGNESFSQPDISGLVERFAITSREEEIIELICQGKTNQEIADDLFISLQTVKDHNYNIFQKTGVRNRVQLVKLFGRS